MAQLTNTAFNAHKYSAVDNQNTTIRSTEDTAGMNCLKKTLYLECFSHHLEYKNYYYKYTFGSQYVNNYTLHGFGSVA
jgi:hypothetical protein